MKRIITDVSDDRVRTALTEDGSLVELLVDAAGSRSVAGNIYAGAVKAILPNQFAFIDIGLERNGFLNLADKREERLAARLKQGDELPVQALRDPTGNKGAHLTSELSLPGRYVVILNRRGGDGTGTDANGDENTAADNSIDANDDEGAGTDANGDDDAGADNDDVAEPDNDTVADTGVDINKSGVSVSKKITARAERSRLIKTVNKYLPKNFGAIVRTNAANADEDAIAGEIKELAALMEKILREGPLRKAPALLRGGGPIPASHVCELYTEDFSQIIINSADEAAHVKAVPGIPAEKIFIYTEEEPVFDRYFINPAIKRALERKVWLKSGGFLVIDRTESCFVIDVNTGKSAGASGHERSMMKTNLEAADEIAYQIRLRNLSGMIIIDFIGVRSGDKKLIRERLSNALSSDRIHTNILDSSVLGLFILTRKRTREPLSHAAAGFK